jgi:predicted anti-sigma-YlaC factor YlaD
MKKNKTSCKDVMNHICENLGHEINSPECISIKEHLAVCNKCQKYFFSVEQTIDLYRKYNIKPDNKVHERLVKYLHLDE